MAKDKALKMELGSTLVLHDPDDWFGEEVTVPVFAENAEEYAISLPLRVPEWAEELCGLGHFQLENSERVLRVQRRIAKDDPLIVRTQIIYTPTARERLEREMTQAVVPHALRFIRHQAIRVRAA